MGAAGGGAAKGSKLATWIFVAAVAGVIAGWAANSVALDAAAAGYRVTVAASLCRGITPETTAAALAAMRAVGIAVAGELSCLGAEKSTP